MTPEALQLTVDLSKHLHHRMTEVAMQTAALASAKEQALAIVINSCCFVICDVIYTMRHLGAGDETITPLLAKIAAELNEAATCELKEKLNV